MDKVEKFKELLGTLLIKTQVYGMNNEYFSLKEESEKTNELNKFEQELIKMYEEAINGKD